MFSRFIDLIIPSRNTTSTPNNATAGGSRSNRSKQGDSNVLVEVEAAMKAYPEGSQEHTVLNLLKTLQY